MKNRMSFLVVALMVVVFSLFGCATIFSGTHDQVTVVSQDADTTIMADGIMKGKGTVSFDVNNRGTHHSIMVKKEGCQDTIIQTTSNFNGVSIWNIFFWPGFLVDLATEAMFKVSPTTYIVNPVCPVIVKQK
jgi:uncharacterized protein YceK